MFAIDRQNAASIAGTILTTKALVSDIPEKKPEMPMGGHDHVVSHPAERSQSFDKNLPRGPEGSI